MVSEYNLRKCAQYKEMKKMNRTEYNQKAKRLDEDIKRYQALIDITRDKLTESIEDRKVLYHGGWTE